MFTLPLSLQLAINASSSCLLFLSIPLEPKWVLWLSSKPELVILSTGSVSVPTQPGVSPEDFIFAMSFRNIISEMIYAIAAGEKPNFVLNSVMLKNGPTCADMTFATPAVACETELDTYTEGESAVLTPKTVGTV
jgi:hypothetical protein